MLIGKAGNWVSSIANGDLSRTSKKPSLCDLRML